MAANVKTIAVQQTLHGYERGHHLLAGSLALTALAARRLQIATDLSGPAIVRGFENYLTGFALDDSFYAIARTWYADEMPRPGCVWTHTLLVRVRDVPQVRHLASFLPYFRRPTLGESLEAYTRPLSVDVAARSGGSVITDDRAQAMIAALYSSANRSVVVPAAAAGDFDALALALWQLHPTWLRRTFSFCTGALSLAAAETARDLLVIPDSLVRRLRNDTVIVVATSSEPSPWIRVITEQLAWPNARPHLRFFASDVVRDRTSIRSVAEVMAAVRAANVDGASVSSVLELTADRFPDPSEARQLKAVLLNPKRRFLTARPADLLQSLATHDQVIVAFAPRLKTLLRLIQNSDREDPHTRMQLVVQLLHAHRADAVLRGILTSVTAREVSTGTTQVVVEALRLSAKHSRSGELWASLGVRGNEILRTAADEQQQFPLHRWADILTGVLRSGAAVSVQRSLLDLMPAEMIRDVLARTPLTSVSLATRESLLAGLLARPVVVHELLETAPAGDWIELAVDILYARPALFTSAVPSFCRLIATGGSATANLHPFAALLGLRETNIDIIPCILRAAAQLHRTLADEPTRRLQEFADQELPSIGWEYAWDLCERLCHAIARRFVEGSWPRDLLFAEVDDYTLFRSIVRVATYSKTGRRWLDRVQRAVLKRQIAATQWQRRVVLS